VPARREKQLVLKEQQCFYSVEPCNSLKTPGFRDYFRKRLETGPPQQTDAHAFGVQFIPDTSIGSRIVNKRNMVVCFTSHGLFRAVFLKELRERLCERVRDIKLAYNIEPAPGKYPEIKIRRAFSQPFDKRREDHHGSVTSACEANNG
jgi:hypothetical protein